MQCGKQVLVLVVVALLGATGIQACSVSSKYKADSEFKAEQKK